MSTFLQKDEKRFKMKDYLQALFIILYSKEVVTFYVLAHYMCFVFCLFTTLFFPLVICVLQKIQAACPLLEESQYFHVLNIVILLK